MEPTAKRSARVESEKEHFSGRRRGMRRLCVMPVECLGASGSFHGRTVDVSRRGALVEIRDPRFPSRSDGLMAFAERVAQEFPRGFALLFADPPLRVEVRVARVTRHAATGASLVGCEFATALPTRVCRALGLATGAASPATTRRIRSGS